MYMINEANKKQHDYVTYGRQFAAYRWYKPLITGVLFAIIYVIMAVILLAAVSITGSVMGGSVTDDLLDMLNGYEAINGANVTKTITLLGGTALMLPALALARLFVRDRSFSSYSSARGGWDHGVFFRTLLLTLPVVVVPIVIDTLRQHPTMNNGFTLGSFIVLLLIGPFQCIAEEYVFRGLLMQTMGSWFRNSVAAVILSSLIFALSHGYNLVGNIGILINGVSFALVAWMTRGIEASSAWHVANNMTIFIMTGLGLGTVSSEQNVQGLIFEIAIDVVFVALIFFVSKKTGWFDHVKKEDAMAFNDRYVAKMQKKAAKKGRPYEPPEGIPLRIASAPETSFASKDDAESSYIEKH